MILTNPKERDRFLRFAVVGIIGAIIDFGLFNLLRSKTPLIDVYAGTISFTAAVISNFVWNRFWTYPDSRSKKLHHQLVQFGIISVIGLGIRALMLAVLEPPIIGFFRNVVHINVGMFTPSFTGSNVTVAIAIVVVMFWNFFANRYWTYGDVES